MMKNNNKKGSQLEKDSIQPEYKMIVNKRNKKTCQNKGRFKRRADLTTDLQD